MKSPDNIAAKMCGCGRPLDSSSRSNCNVCYWADFLEEMKTTLPEAISKAGLIPKPEHCNKCVDNGYTTELAYPDNPYSFMTELVLCPCTKNPNSAYNVFNQIKENHNENE